MEKKGKEKEDKIEMYLNLEKDFSSIQQQEDSFTKEGVYGLS